ncbi:unannotated protein [freshwater metagenome]|uniref:Unannotated protein n=2 Tax=freshwater metagenome TaxID=449393 RepID=A0A6J6XRL8_9ZZZZ|nr:ABC transporter substrate-binding protein [Actinomycetota bacterium]
MRGIKLRRLLVIASVSGIALMLTGCSGSNGSTASGCNEIAIASIGPTTGLDNGSGRPPRDAAELAVRQYNAKHPDCPVGLLTYDTQGIPENASNLADGIAADTRIVGVVGPTFSGETAAMMPAFEDAGLPVITGSATNPTLSQQGWKTFHRIVGNDATQGPAAAVYITSELGSKRVAVIDDTGLYGKSIGDLTATSLVQLGATVALRTTVDPESVDYSAAVSALIGADADAIYFGGVSAPGARLVRQIRDAGITAPFIGGDGINSGDFVTGSGGAAVGARFTCPCINASRPIGKAQIAFSKAYSDVYGIAPGYFAAEYYDAANLLLDAIEDGQGTRSGIQTWLKTANMKGLTKQIEFGKTGEVKAGSVFIFEVTPEGEFNQVAEVIGKKILK